MWHDEDMGVAHYMMWSVPAESRVLNTMAKAECGIASSAALLYTPTYQISSLAREGAPTATIYFPQVGVQLSDTPAKAMTHSGGRAMLGLCRSEPGGCARIRRPHGHHTLAALTKRHLPPRRGCPVTQRSEPYDGLR